MAITQSSGKYVLQVATFSAAREEAAALAMSVLIDTPWALRAKLRTNAKRSTCARASVIMTASLNIEKGLHATLSTRNYLFANTLRSFYWLEPQEDRPALAHLPATAKSLAMWLAMVAKGDFLALPSIIAVGAVYHSPVEWHAYPGRDFRFNEAGEITDIDLIARPWHSARAPS